MISERELYKNVGRNICLLRKAFGETQMELSLAIGINSPNAISNYENGIRIPEREILIGRCSNLLFIPA